MSALTTHHEPAAPTIAEVASRSGMTPDDLGELLRAFSDVTERLQRTHETLRAEVARLQGELSSANAQLRRARELAALGEMAAGIAHEIRNPLGSIRLYAGMLEQDLEDRPQERQVAGKIAGAVKGLDHIVSDVLSFAREVRITPASVDAGALFDRAADTCRDRIDSAGAVVEVTGAGEGAIDCDGDLLHQALTNLIRNAADAVAENPAARARRIGLEASVMGDEVSLAVEDSGPGMPEDVRQRMFNPFFTTRKAGTGLGLAIVHRIVDAHGGRIDVSDGALGGARVAMVLPRHTQTQTPGDGGTRPDRSHGGDR